MAESRFVEHEYRDVQVGTRGAGDRHHRAVDEQAPFAEPGHPVDQVLVRATLQFELREIRVLRHGCCTRDRASRVTDG